VRRGEAPRAIFGKRGEIFVSRSQREREREIKRQRRELRLYGSSTYTYCNQEFRLIENNRFHYL
jgi:hypothetical protein